ncbi:MAG: beta-N-acetylhexosaminidase [Muribaculaceae bacterium]|nr:beta-N-acetylhexosaminidase [Muribaculaceae bacterium]
MGSFLIFAKTQEPLVPMPNSLTYEGEGFNSTGKPVSIGIADSALEPSSLLLQTILKKRGIENTKTSESIKPNIVLNIDPSLAGNEHYRLVVDETGINISGASPEAVFRAVNTLDQLLLENISNDGVINLPGMIIDDAPRFPYRALMLDPARHFLSVDEVKHFIDQMAKYKFNVLQLHLTDDQGWRIHLDKHPELSSEKHYTRKDIQEIIDYAAQNYIEVVPEIDVPGHTSAFLAVYPEMGCINRQAEPIEVGKTDNRMLCASNNDVYEILEDIITEMATIFPSDYIHLGGDEAAIKNNWAKCDSCLALMNRLGFDDPSQLMIPFFDKTLGYVKENGKKPILWCELNNIYPPADDYLFPYPEGITLVTWRNGLTPTCIELTGKSNYPLIMAPGEYAYLDYPQFKGDLPEFNNWGMPTTTLKKTYEFDPGYGLDDSDRSHIAGVMGTLWGEAILDINRATYMAFPRALALAEAGWTNMDNREWDSFKQRMYPNLYDLMKSGVSFRVPFEIAD